MQATRAVSTTGSNSKSRYNIKYMYKQELLYYTYIASLTASDQNHTVSFFHGQFKEVKTIQPCLFYISQEN
jgi:hypothetical protein